MNKIDNMELKNDNWIVDLYCFLNIIQIVSTIHVIPLIP